MGSSWDRRIDNVTQRFKVLDEFNSEAVVDKETGVVWERRPQQGCRPMAKCAFDVRSKDCRRTWRMEARCLQRVSKSDRPCSNRSYDATTAGRTPIPGCSARAAYWSATVFADEPGFALIVNMVVVSGSDAPIAVFDANATGGLYLPWAVRGGSPRLDSY